MHNQRELGSPYHALFSFVITTDSTLKRKYLWPGRTSMRLPHRPAYFRPCVFAFVCLYRDRFALARGNVISSTTNSPLPMEFRRYFHLSPILPPSLSLFTHHPFLRAFRFAYERSKVITGKMKTQTNYRVLDRKPR